MSDTDFPNPMEDDICHIYPMDLICGHCGENWGCHGGMLCPNAQPTTFIPAEYVTAQRECGQLRALLGGVLSSASPHPQHNPAMFQAWSRATQWLADHPTQ